jgi:hypothetical protein
MPEDITEQSRAPDTAATRHGMRATGLLSTTSTAVKPKAIDRVQATWKAQTMSVAPVPRTSSVTAAANAGKSPDRRRISMKRRTAHAICAAKAAASYGQ